LGGVAVSVAPFHCLCRRFIFFQFLTWRRPIVLGRRNRDSALTIRGFRRFALGGCTEGRLGPYKHCVETFVPMVQKSDISGRGNAFAFAASLHTRAWGFSRTPEWPWSCDWCPFIGAKRRPLTTRMAAKVASEGCCPGTKNNIPKRTRSNP
jgi:hypothetical protein